MTVSHPVFTEGAILAAADLTALETASRDRDARHARYLHTPGVCVGLELTTESRTTTSGAAYVDVTLQPGYAVDGTGRELVVAEAMPLSPDTFLTDNPNPTLESGQTYTVWCPVFIRGFDLDAAPGAPTSSCLAGTATSQVEETVDVEFGRPGDAEAAQTTPGPDAGPGNGAWRILVGFVRLDTGIERFIATSTTSDGTGVPGAGARAALVAGQSGRVEVRTMPTTSAGVSALAVDNASGLVFGTHDGTGTITPLMSVDASGNLVVSGTLTGVLAAGSVRVIAGTASDGLVLPLPVGIDADAVDSGDVVLSVQLSPRLPDPAGAPAGADFFAPAQCRIDADRRVACWGSWVGLATNTLTPVPASCDYLIVATVP